MGRTHQTVIIGLVVLTLAGRASARPQDGLKPVLPPPAGSTLTLAQAIDIALANNPDTRSAWLQARAAELGVGSARAAYYPEVDVLASATRSRAAAEGASAQTTI